MPDWKAILSAARTVLVVDWPTREVPDTLALAGYEVVVHGGPGPEDYVAYEVVDGEVVERRVGRPPAKAEVVWSYRPGDELAEIIAAAQAVGAGTVWLHAEVAAGAPGARATVEAAGLTYLDEPDIVDAVRELA